MKFSNSLAVVCAILAVTTTSVIFAEAALSFDDALANTLRLNHIQVLATHNSYHVFGPKKYRDTLTHVESDPQIPAGQAAWLYQHAPFDYQLGTQNVRSVELDVFYDPHGGRYSYRRGLNIIGATEAEMKGPAALDAPGFKVLHIQDIDPWVHCYTFKECLTGVKTWSDANPTHVPIMITMELKDDVIQDPLRLGFATPIAYNFSVALLLEQEVKEVFTDWATRIISPSNMLTSHCSGTQPTIQRCIQNNGWPTLGSTRGKIYFHLLKRGVDYYSQDGAGNVDYSGAGRLFFYDSQCQGGTCDGGGSITNVLSATSIVSYGDANANSLAVVNAGYMVRARTDSNGNEARASNTTRRDDAIAQGHFVATDFPKPAQTGVISPIPGAYTTGYNVYVPPRCHPVTQSSCAGTLTQDPVGAPVTTTFITDDPNFDFRAFFGNFTFGSNTITFLEGWVTNAGLDTPLRELSADVANYVPPVYTALGYAERIRDTPRLYGDTKQWSKDNDENQKHAIGIVLFGVPIILYGIIFFTLSICFFFCPCCCDRELKESINQDKRARKALCILITVWGLACCGAIIAFTGVGLMKSGMNDVTSEARGLSKVVDDALADTEQLVVSVDIAKNTTQVLETLCPDTAELLGVINNFPDVKEARQSLNISASKDINEYSDTTDEWVDRVFDVCVAFLVAAVVVLLLIVLCAWRSEKFLGADGCTRVGVRCVLIPLGMFTVLILCIICAVLLILSGVFSDFCADEAGGPDAVVLRFLNDSADALDYVGYRLSCKGNNTIFDTINNASSLVNLGLDFSPLLPLAKYQCPTTAGSNAYVAAVTANQQVLLEVDNAIFTAKELVACKTFNSLYVNTVHKSVCKSLLEGFILVWVGILLLVMPMSIIMCKGGRAILASVHATTIEEFPSKSYSGENDFDQRNAAVEMPPTDSSTTKW